MTTYKRTKKIAGLGLLLGCALFAAGCSNSSDKTATVHLVGSVMSDPDKAITTPVYWKGAKSVTELSRVDPSCSGYANSVVVSGQDTHIAGTTFVCSDDKTVRTPVAAYWKNGERTDLERPAAHSQEASEAQQVFVAEGSVYIAGYVTGDNGHLPVYWKNNKVVYLTDLPYEATSARASNIYVDGSDIYVSGAVLFGSAAYPVYWKNGKAFELPLPEGCTGTSVPLPIKVSNGEVYVFGHLHRSRTKTIAYASELPVYWKNGELVRILPSETDKGYSYGGTLYNGVPYSAGALYEGTLTTPAVWADKKRQRLSMLDEGLYGMAHDVFVDNFAVYAAGWTFKSDDPSDPSAYRRAVPCYWASSTRVDLPTINNMPAFAREIFVTH